jgi:hypothetical protein
MPQELNWCGEPIGEGEGYGGRPENIPETWSQPKNQNSVITEGAVSEVFGNGAYSLTRTEAGKRPELLTGTHRTGCYRALRLNGRFGQHLHSDGAMLSWR